MESNPRRARRILGTGVCLFFGGLVVIAIFIGVSGGVNSPTDEPRKWAAENWALGISPNLLDAQRPSWKQADVQITKDNDRSYAKLTIRHLPLDLSGNAFTQWESDVDAVHAGDRVVQLADGGTIEVTAFGMNMPGASPVWLDGLGKGENPEIRLADKFAYEPSFYVQFQARNTDAVQIRDVGIGCARVRRLHRVGIRSEVRQADNQGQFFAVRISAPFWHSIDPVIVADVVYDCSSPTPIEFKTGATAKIGDTEVSLLAAASSSLFLLGHKPVPDGSGIWEARFSESTTGIYTSLVALVEPQQPPERLLFEARLKSGFVLPFAKPHFCPPARRAPIQSYRMDVSSEKIAEIQTRIANRVDRIVIRLPRIESPAEPPGGTDNLFDLTIPSAVVENFRDFEDYLGNLTQCRIEIIGERSIPSAPVNLSGMTGGEIFDFARREFGHAAYDPETHTITLGGEPSWFDKFLARSQQLLENIGLK